MREKTVTIIYFKGDIGKARTIEFTPKGFFTLIVVVCLFILLFIGSVALSITLYLERDRGVAEQPTLLREKEGLMKEIKDMQDRIDSLQRLVSLYQEKQVLTEASGTVEAGMRGQEAKVSPQGLIVSEAPAPVRVEGFVVKDRGDGNGIEVSFDLVKEVDDGTVLAGYVVIVGEGGSPPSYATSPNTVEVRDGIPINYKRGDSFAIRRLKGIKGIIQLANIGGPKRMVVFVYSRDGEPLLKREFPIER